MVDQTPLDASVPSRDHIAPHAVMNLRSLSKSYGATLALDAINFDLIPGRVHALLGENGAGKSSLIRVLVGAELPTSGSIELRGDPVSFASAAHAIKSGIIPIYQHLSLFPQLSVIENLYGFDAAMPGLRPAHHGAEARCLAQDALTRVGLTVSLDRKVDTLSLGEMQLLEIARGMLRECRVLLLDEPTAALNVEESERLLGLVRDLADSGVAIVYVSHKTHEIRAIADDVTVLRDGRSVIMGAALKDTSVEDLIEAMLGHSLAVSDKAQSNPGEKCLRVDSVEIDGHPPLSIDIHEGEIVGIALMAGAGTETLVEVLAGARRPERGEVRIANTPILSRQSAVEQGIGYVPPDRHKEGIFLPLSATLNASASSLSSLTRRGIISRKSERQRFDTQFEAMQLSPMDPGRRIGAFSGGNQQKVLLARNLGLENLRALVLAEPTRGIDVKARDHIHSVVAEAAATGCAVVLASSDLEELAALSHRTLIIKDGTVFQTLPAGSSPEKIALAMQDGAAK